MDRDMIIRALAEQLARSDDRDDLAAASVLYALMGSLASGRARGMAAHVVLFAEAARAELLREVGE